jgi:hypothetical protein
MVAVRMVQVAVDEIVNVVPVRHCRVAAVRTVNMARSVVVAVMIVNAAVGVGRRHFEDALVDVIAVRVVQMAVMQIVDVTIVFDRQVTAARTMLMFMLLHFCTGSHNQILLENADENDSRGSMPAPDPVLSKVYLRFGDQAYRWARLPK